MFGIGSPLTDLPADLREAVPEQGRPVVYAGMSTPWGRADYCTIIAPGIGSVGTPGHGGIKVCAKLNKQIPDYLRQAGGWYEEDCDWSIPYAALGCYIRQHAPEDHAKHFDSAMKTLKSWHPDGYERLTGISIKPGESYQRDKAIFRREHANDLQGVSAVGRNVPGQGGHVAVCACVGGRTEQGQYAGELRYFLVTTEEYQARGTHPFIIDEARHPEVTAEMAGF